jgi:hypothetical protein
MHLYAFLLLCLVSCCLCETITWSSSKSGDWNVASNWNKNRVPSTFDDVVIETPQSGSEFTVTIKNNVHVSTITVQGNMFDKVTINQEQSIVEG